MVFPDFNTWVGIWTIIGGIAALIAIAVSIWLAKTGAQPAPLQQPVLQAPSAEVKADGDGDGAAPGPVTARSGTEPQQRVETREPLAPPADIARGQEHRSKEEAGGPADDRALRRDAIRSAFNSAKMLTLGIDRDAAYRDIIAAAIAQHFPEEAEPIADSFTLQIDRDAAYKKIIAEYIGLKRFADASKTIQKLSLGIDRDAANKELIQKINPASSR